MLKLEIKKDIKIVRLAIKEQIGDLQQVSRAESAGSPNASSTTACTFGFHDENTVGRFALSGFSVVLASR